MLNGQVWIQKRPQGLVDPEHGRDDKKIHQCRKDRKVNWKTPDQLDHLSKERISYSLNIYLTRIIDIFFKPQTLVPPARAGENTDKRDEGWHSMRIFSKSVVIFWKNSLSITNFIYKNFIERVISLKQSPISETFPLRGVCYPAQKSRRLAMMLINCFV